MAGRQSPRRRRTPVAARCVLSHHPQRRRHYPPFTQKYHHSPLPRLHHRRSYLRLELWRHATGHQALRPNRRLDCGTAADGRRRQSGNCTSRQRWATANSPNPESLAVLPSSSRLNSWESADTSHFCPIKAV